MIAVAQDTVQAVTSYGELDYVTHPIDTLTTPRGLGVGRGPWMPVDYRSVHTDVSIGWVPEVPTDIVTHTPPYQTSSLYTDESLRLVNNPSPPPTGKLARNLSSTFSNTRTSYLKRLAAALGGDTG